MSRAQSQRPPAVERRPRGDAGSVFVEAVISAAIVAMALGATLQVVADGARRDRSVEARRLALLVAQSEMAAVGSEIPLQGGETDGRADDLFWRVRMSPYDDGIDASAAGSLWRVTVSVRSAEHSADLVRLETLRIGPNSG